MQVYTFTAPAFWASYLINGDASGLCPGEAKRIDEYMALAHPGVDVHDVGEPGFSWTYDLYGGDVPGGDLAEYTGLVHA